IDENSLAATLEWMLTGLEQMNRDQMRWLDKPLTLTLTGPAGGSWRINPAGDGRLTVTESAGTAAAAAITGGSTDFPAGRRIAWHGALPVSPSQATRSTPKSSSTHYTSSDEALAAGTGLGIETRRPMLKEWRSCSEYVHSASKGAAKLSVLVIVDDRTGRRFVRSVGRCENR
ncbi:MAG: hypothetical protein QOI29_849, partial [Mycobacterium sp.]|nr:hypothetical protein [Mycobacterium sp.]